jgi:uncharacterized protein (TIGR02145 family)
MKRKIRKIPLFIAVFIVFLSSNCKKDYDIVITPGPDVIDIDSNVYHSVQIGDQIWMTENLRVTHFNNGDSIQLITTDTLWAQNPAYCNYNNDTNNVIPYGRLYNSYVIGYGIAPAGWHVPSDDEWKTLRKYLGTKKTAGARMKEEGTAHWNSPNEGANNESGFSGLPGGQRGFTDSEMGSKGYWWSSSQASGATFKWAYILSADDEALTREAKNWDYFYSIRCVKD